MESIFNALTPIALAVVMAGLGLSLSPSDFRRILQRPRAALAGVLGQLVLLPLLAGLLLVVAPQEQAIAVGALCLVAAPGGAVSNLISHLGHGDTALSVSLTAITSVVSILWAPLVLEVGMAQFGLAQAGELNKALVVGQLVVLVLVPIAGGMGIARRWPGFAARADRPVRLLASLLVVLVITSGVLGHLDTIVDSARRSLGVIIPLNLLGMAGGLGLAAALGLNVRERFTVSVEVGVQNVPLAIALGGTVLGDHQYTLVASIYALFSLPAALLWAKLFGAASPAAQSGA